MNWKQWEDQGELKRCIRGWIDTGACRTHIVDSVTSELKNKYTRKQVHRAINELKRDMLIIHCGYSNYMVREWANVSVTIGTGHDDRTKAFRRLIREGVFHDDMYTEGLVALEDVPEESKAWLDNKYTPQQKKNFDDRRARIENGTFWTHKDTQKLSGLFSTDQ
jgi:hypothetical protein